METTQHIPADVRERIRDAIREGVRYVAKADGAYLYEPSVDETVDRILALLRTPRGEGEAKFDVGDPAALRLAASKLEASGYDVLALRLRNIADQIKCVIAARRSKAQGDAEALAALIVRIWTRCKNEGPHYRETDEFWADFERAYQLALLRTPRGEEASGLADCIITCMGCGQDFDADDDTQARYHEAACEVVDHEPARVEIARRLRGAALRSEADALDLIRWAESQGAALEPVAGNIMPPGTYACYAGDADDPYMGPGILGAIRAARRGEGGGE